MMVLTNELGHPWAVEPLSDGNLLVTVGRWGDRNIQAAGFVSEGQLREVEHGTNGGDELNRVDFIYPIM